MAATRPVSRRSSLRRRPPRSGFTLLAILIMMVFGISIAAAVMVVSSATSAEQTRVERVQSVFTSLTTAGTGIPLFVADIGDPPLQLSHLSSPITTAGSSICGKSYSTANVNSWSGRYASRVFPVTGTPVGIGQAGDTLIYEEVSGAPRAVLIIRSVPAGEAARLDARIDTLAGSGGSAFGFVRWNTSDGTGLVTLRWSTPMAKKCAGANAGPTAAFTVVCTGLSCVFTDGSTDSDGTIASWSWTFGDATTSTLQNPVKVYAAPGTYSVVLVVTDNQGSEGSVSQNVSVSNIILSGIGRRQGPDRYADLTWTGATTANVDVYRDNVLVVTTLNDGAYTDTISNGTFLYRVCEQGTQICSNTVSVTP